MTSRIRNEENAVKLFISVLCATLCLAAQSAPPPSVSKIFDGQIKTIESELVPLAEAMPAEKYNFAPKDGEFKNVRTFGQQVSHVAAVIYLASAAVLGEKPPVDTGGESGPKSLGGKDQIVKFLKDSFAYAHKAMDSLTAENMTEIVQSPFGNNRVTRVSMATVPVWHSFDHYGQMVVYARMNGIIPPASRQQ
jgi:DinB superfamily